MEMPKDGIKRWPHFLFQRNWQNHCRGDNLGTSRDKRGIKAGERRTKELPGGLETLRTTASLHIVGATSPFPVYTVKHRDGQAPAPSLGFVQLC